MNIIILVVSLSLFSNYLACPTPFPIIEEIFIKATKKQRILNKLICCAFFCKAGKKNISFFSKSRAHKKGICEQHKKEVYIKIFHHFCSLSEQKQTKEVHAHGKERVVSVIFCVAVFSDRV